jgi:hypothetical protein
MHPSCVKISTITKQTELSFHLCLVTWEFRWLHPKWFLSLRYVQPKPCIHLVSRLALCPNGLNWASNWASSPRSTIVGIQIDSEPMVHLVQTMNVSCTDTNTISNTDQNEIPLDPRHLGRPSSKRFLSLWYVRRKPCTCLAARLAQSPNGLNRASTWASSPRTAIGFVQNDFWAYGTFGSNHAPILHLH